jgi:hypothetical protein
MNGLSVRRLVPFGNLQRIPWAMLAIAFPSRANPAPEATLGSAAIDVIAYTKMAARSTPM